MKPNRWERVVNNSVKRLKSTIDTAGVKTKKEKPFMQPELTTTEQLYLYDHMTPEQESNAIQSVGMENYVKIMQDMQNKRRRINNA